MKAFAENATRDRDWTETETASGPLIPSHSNKKRSTGFPAQQQSTGN